jgi:ectoine hydroxylase-related dioxygenase (phytanoyl-CoA dioxygenase family)
MSLTTALDIDIEYKITPEQIAYFREMGFIKLKNVLSPEVLAYYGDIITDHVLKKSAHYKPLEQRDTYGKAFLQISNIWEENPTVKEFVMGKRLARIATQLMGVKGVRMYHDQALYKEGGGGVTPWHADQYYWPLSNPNTITAWIPLQATPMNMGPLAFAARSQTMEFGRDLPISDESEAKLQQALKDNNYEYVDTPFDLGEVSYHYGWCYHRAGPNTSDQARKVMTIIYMDQEIRVTEPKNPAHRNDLKRWMPGAQIGEVPATHLNPVIYSE